MAKTPKPRWNSARKCWEAKCGPVGADGRRKREYAPRELGAHDEPKAWAWSEARVKAGAAVVVRPGEMPVNAVVAAYLAAAKGRVASKTMKAAHLRNRVIHLRHFLEFPIDRSRSAGELPAADLNPEDVERFLAAMAAVPYSAHYVAGIGRSIRAAFRWATKRGSAGRGRLLEADPTEGFKIPAVPDAPERFAERAEAAAWLRWLWRRGDRATEAGRYRLLFALAQRLLIHSGARPGEACALLWSDFKWAGWTTTIGHAAARVTIPATRWKTGALTGEARTVFIAPSLTRAIRREYERAKATRAHVFVHGAGRGGKGKGDPWESGSAMSKTVTRLRRDAIAEAQAAREKIKLGAPITPAEAKVAKLEIQDEGDNRLVNYRWRHTAASELLMLGVDPTTVAKLLGTSVEMLMKHYGHLLDDHLAKAASQAIGRKRTR